MHPNRTVCAVLREIRDLDERKNYSMLLSLVEEVQSLVNRMESSLYDKADYKTYRERAKKEYKKYKKYKKINNEREDNNDTD